jgi:hypothetical protein
MNSPLFNQNALPLCFMRHALCLLLAENAAHQGKTKAGHLRMETYY